MTTLKYLFIIINTLFITMIVLIILEIYGIIEIKVGPINSIVRRYLSRIKYLYKPVKRKMRSNQKEKLSHSKYHQPNTNITPKKVLFVMLKIIVAIYIILCASLYVFQEKFIFFPQKLDKNYTFNFEQAFEEINIKSNDGKLLNGLLFKTDNSKGLIFYLHGNAGNLSSWGEVATAYTNLNYDVFMLDYRGYGKSEGKINDQSQLFDDDQLAYNQMKEKYNENNIIVLGYSIGTGLASKLASTNNPSLLILQAPYYNLSDLMKKQFPFVPTFLLKYKLNNNEYLKQCKMPVVIFHGNQDNVIYYGSSQKLKSEFKQGDTLITLHRQGHNVMTNNEEYQTELEKILAR